MQGAIDGERLLPTVSFQHVHHNLLLASENRGAFSAQNEKASSEKSRSARSGRNTNSARCIGKECRRLGWISESDVGVPFTMLLIASSLPLTINQLTRRARQMSRITAIDGTAVSLAGGCVLESPGCEMRCFLNRGSPLATSSTCFHLIQAQRFSVLDILVSDDTFGLANRLSRLPK
eukprot:7387212-Prymnesium_polylepis.1